MIGAIPKTSFLLLCGWKIILDREVIKTINQEFVSEKEDKMVKKHVVS